MYANLILYFQTSKKHGKLHCYYSERTLCCRKSDELQLKHTICKQTEVFTQNFQMLRNVKLCDKRCKVKLLGIYHRMRSQVCHLSEISWRNEDNQLSTTFFCCYDLPYFLKKWYVLENWGNLVAFASNPDTFGYNRQERDSEQGNADRKLT